MLHSETLCRLIAQAAKLSPHEVFTVALATHDLLHKAEQEPAMRPPFVTSKMLASYLLEFCFVVPSGLILPGALCEHVAWLNRLDVIVVDDPAQTMPVQADKAAMRAAMIEIQA